MSLDEQRRNEQTRVSVNPEEKMMRAQNRDQQLDPLAAVAKQHDDMAKEVLDGQYGISARVEIAEFLKKTSITSLDGSEQHDALQLLEQRLYARNRLIFDDAPEDKKGRIAFVLALVKAYALQPLKMNGG